jgi:hypothetical protein
MEMKLEYAEDCENHRIKICDETKYGQFDSVSRNLLVYNCAGQLLNPFNSFGEYCVNLTGDFLAGDVVTLVLNGVASTYTVQASDIILPDPSIDATTARGMTYSNILKGIAEQLKTNSSFCGNDLNITVGNCQADCMLRIKSKLPGIQFNLTGSVSPIILMGDLCIGAQDIAAIAAANGNMYSVLTGYVYTYNFIHYIFAFDAGPFDITITPPGMIFGAATVLCPFISALPRPNIPNILVNGTQASVPNLGATKCQTMPIHTDEIITARLSVRITHPPLYVQTLTITGGAIGIANNITISPPAPPLPGINLSMVMGFCGNTNLLTAQSLTDSFNTMCKLAGAELYVWAVRDFNKVNIYVLAQSFLPAQINFSKFDAGAAVSTISVATLIPPMDEYIDHRFTFGSFCRLHNAIASRLVRAATCSDGNTQAALKLQARLRTIKDYICEAHVESACKLLNVTKNSQEYVNACGC